MRRWIRYSLWCLLLGVILLAGGLGVSYWRYLQLIKPSVGWNSEGQVVLRGELTPQLLQMFKVFEETHDLRHQHLLVRSPGGLALVGMEIGRMVHSLQMDVEVDAFCVSSCANYIFTAGRHKYLRHDSGLIFHGGNLQANMAEKRADKSRWGKARHEAAIVAFSEEDQRLLREMLPPSTAQVPPSEREQELAFFRHLGVNPLITIYGQLGEYRQAYETAHHIGFHYTMVDLSKFGVTNVHFLGEGEWRPHTNPYDGSPYWVKVDTEQLREYSRDYGIDWGGVDGDSADSSQSNNR